MMINKRLIGLVPWVKKDIGIKVGLLWFSLIISILFWASLVHIMNQYESGYQVMLPVYMAVLLLIVGKFLTIKMVGKKTEKMTGQIKTTLREKIYGKMGALGSGYNKYMPTSQIVQVASEGVEQLEIYFGNYLPQFFYALLAPITLFLVFFTMSPLVATVLLLCVIGIPLAIIFIQKVAKKLFRKYWNQYTSLGDIFLENLQGLTTLKVYSADEKYHQEMDKASETFRKMTMKVLKMQLNSVTVMDIIAYGGTGVGMILTAVAFSKGQVSFGEGLFMIMLSSEFFLSMRTFGSYFHIAMNGMAASEKMFQFLDIAEGEKREEQFTEGDVVLKDISFSYGEDISALENISLTVSKGAFFSIVGQSGCGKSTLAKVLSGELDIFSGDYIIGGKTVKGVAISSIAKEVTVVNSQSYIFGGTVRSCLKEGKRQGTEEEMYQVLEKANLKEFVQSRQGLDTKIQDGGSNLSGGQRQRLAIARALLKESQIYIFDEASSNIDVESENTILKMIHELAGTCTIIFISHRLQNVIHSDQIAMMEKGQIVETGTHQRLMENDGPYFRMFSAQKELEQVRKGGHYEA